MDETEDFQIETIMDHHKCFICEKSFSSASNLNRHIKIIHKHEPVVPGTVKCGLCDDDFPTMDKLQEHLTDGHYIEIEIGHYAFGSDKEFRNWKESEEIATSSKFVKHRGSEMGSDGELATYFCHRSGKASLIGKESRKRSVKTQGSNKIGCHCPAKITMLKAFPDCLEVEYVKTHVGHTTDIKRVPLTHSERRAIALKQRMKLSVEEVLKDMQDSYSGEQSDRLNLLTRQDLKNIARDFKISKDGDFFGNDTTTVEEWIKDMSENEENPIRCYKPQGEKSEYFPNLGPDDFILVFMTRTQKEMLVTYGEAIVVDVTDDSNVDEFELISVLVIDDKKEGYPCCFILTNRVDEVAMKVAFESIRAVTGDLTPSVFLSDDEIEETFMAWESTFGFSGHRLLCSWHVIRAWERNKLYIKGSEKVKEEVFEKLRGLMEETDQEIFQNLLGQVCKELLENEDTSAFGTYFSAHYANRPEMWAHSYIPTSGINTTMNVENIHEAIKYDGINGKRVKRLDKTIHALMGYLYRYNRYDKDRLTKDSQSTKRKFKALQQRHFRSTKLALDSVTVVGDGEWDIRSSMTGESYLVQKVGECPRSVQCQMYCIDCGACVHNFSCTCVDYAKRGNMCEHVHLLCRSQIVVTSVISEMYNSEQSNDENDSGEYVQYQEHILLDDVQIKPEVLEESSESIEDLESHKASVTKELQCMIEGSVASCRNEVEIKQFLEYFQQCNENWITTRGVDGDEPKQIYLLISE